MVPRKEHNNFLATNTKEQELDELSQEEIRVWIPNELQGSTENVMGLRNSA